MAAERGHFDLHEWVQGERIQDVVQFGRTLDVEHTDVRDFSHDSPKVKPLSLQLQFPRSLVLQRAQLSDFLRIDPRRDANVYVHVEQHAISTAAIEAPF
jgi:hypothetical protein